MITYCPFCHTHFRVHAEQLAARAGQVRCGKCDRVFDALEYLVEETAPARAIRPKREFGALAADAENTLDSAAGQAANFSAPAQGHTVAQSADVMVEAPASAAESPKAVVSEPAISEPVNTERVLASGASAFGFGPEALAEAAPSVLGWRLGTLLLLLTLLAQAAYHYRGAITLLLPETRPYAAALCASIGCDLPLPRRIELMSIEASDLQADTTNPNVMVLSATLKNRGIFDQQHPSLELTLTDARDQPVVRRVLAPQDYLGEAVNTQTGFAANAEIAIKLFIEGSEVRATGYRLYLFYP